MRQARVLGVLLAVRENVDDGRRTGALVDATTAEGVTQEIRLAGGGERLDWLFGSFYGSSERRYGQSAYARDYVAANGPAVTDFLRAVTGIPDLVWSGPRPLAGHPDTEELFFSDLDYDFEQLAFFGEVTVAVTDRLSLTGGLRWYDFDEERTQVFDGLFADPLDSTGTTSASGVAPRIIASYDVTDGTQVNAQVSKGFRLGGINDLLNAPICSEADLATFGGRGTWEDEELWNYEAALPAYNNPQHPRRLPERPLGHRLLRRQRDRRVGAAGLDQERGTLARVGYLTNRPRSFGVSTRIDF